VNAAGNGRQIHQEEVDMGKKSIRKMLAGVGLAGLIAGAGVAAPGSAFGTSG
jgi:radical SAM modification target selenobiotic family peptide